MLGRKSLTKGVKVEIVEQKAIIDIYTIVEYGVAISKVAEVVQKEVKDAVESMTGLACPTVNVHVQGVTFPPAQNNEANTEE